MADLWDKDEFIRYVRNSNLVRALEYAREKNTPEMIVRHYLRVEFFDALNACEYVVACGISLCTGERFDKFRLDELTGLQLVAVRGYIKMINVMIDPRVEDEFQAVLALSQPVDGLKKKVAAAISEMLAIDVKTLADKVSIYNTLLPHLVLATR